MLRTSRLGRTSQGTAKRKPPKSKRVVPPKSKRNNNRDDDDDDDGTADTGVVDGDPTASDDESDSTSHAAAAAVVSTSPDTRLAAFVLADSSANNRRERDQRTTVRARGISMDIRGLSALSALPLVPVPASTTAYNPAPASPPLHPTNSSATAARVEPTPRLPLAAKWDQLATRIPTGGGFAAMTKSARNDVMKALRGPNGIFERCANSPVSAIPRGLLDWCRAELTRHETTEWKESWTNYNVETVSNSSTTTQPPARELTCVLTRMYLLDTSWGVSIRYSFESLKYGRFHNLRQNYSRASTKFAYTRFHERESIFFSVLN